MLIDFIFSLDQTPSPDGIRDGNYESFSDSFQTSPCARLSHSSLFLLEENTPTGPTLGSVWENSPNPNSGWHFDIREDQPEKKSPSPSTPRSYGGIDEDKENILPSDSDHEALSQTQAQVDNAGPNGLNNIQQDAFGFEIFHYADALAELPVNRYGYPAPPASIFAYDPVPASPTRSPEQMEVDEEDESRREHRADWRRVLDEDQIRELQRLSEVFSSGLEQRGLHNLPYTMAEQRFLGDSDFFMEDRRGTEQQSRRTRGPNF
ncbi:hypothetical protein N7507_008102 [Penicillium longicatenatum]|nr:hypothetical protein N7507_008102 [Penicillium longicatenatum]